mmetsp:Transcript_6570/g.19185  ORF Transcript_6570/g.19185 Transcript_6570/m.19185 type:complete len:224 (-) Transcript_6570:312-983(-)
MVDTGFAPFAWGSNAASSTPVPAGSAGCASPVVAVVAPPAWPACCTTFSMAATTAVAACLMALTTPPWPPPLSPTTSASSKPAVSPDPAPPAPAGASRDGSAAMLRGWMVKCTTRSGGEHSPGAGHSASAGTTSAFSGLWSGSSGAPPPGCAPPCAPPTLAPPREACGEPTPTLEDPGAPDAPPACRATSRCAPAAELAPSAGARGALGVGCASSPVAASCAR